VDWAQSGGDEYTGYWYARGIGRFATGCTDWVAGSSFVITKRVCEKTFTDPMKRS
jgi:hypothetical protein